MEIVGGLRKQMERRRIRALLDREMGHALQLPEGEIIDSNIIQQIPGASIRLAGRIGNNTQKRFSSLRDYANKHLGGVDHGLLPVVTNQYVADLMMHSLRLGSSTVSVIPVLTETVLQFDEIIREKDVEKRTLNSIELCKRLAGEKVGIFKPRWANREYLKILGDGGFDLISPWSNIAGWVVDHGKLIHEKIKTAKANIPSTRAMLKNLANDSNQVSDSLNNAGKNYDKLIRSGHMQRHLQREEVIGSAFRGILLNTASRTEQVSSQTNPMVSAIRELPASADAYDLFSSTLAQLLESSTRAIRLSDAISATGETLIAQEMAGVLIPHMLGEIPLQVVKGMARASQTALYLATYAMAQDARRMGFRENSQLIPSNFPSAVSGIEDIWGIDPTNTRKTRP